MIHIRTAKLALIGWNLSFSFLFFLFLPPLLYSPPSIPPPLSAHHFSLRRSSLNSRRLLTLRWVSIKWKWKKRKSVIWRRVSSMANRSSSKMSWITSPISERSSGKLSILQQWRGRGGGWSWLNTPACFCRTLPVHSFKVHHLNYLVTKLFPL